jgi:hypothetical protein
MQAYILHWRAVRSGEDHAPLQIFTPENFQSGTFHPFKSVCSCPAFAFLYFRAHFRVFLAVSPSSRFRIFVFFAQKSRAPPGLRHRHFLHTILGWLLKFVRYNRMKDFLDKFENAYKRGWSEGGKFENTSRRRGSKLETSWGVWGGKLERLTNVYILYIHIHIHIHGNNGSRLATSPLHPSRARGLSIFKEGWGRHQTSMSWNLGALTRWGLQHVPWANESLICIRTGNPHNYQKRGFASLEGEWVWMLITKGAR